MYRAVNDTAMDNWMNACWQSVAAYVYSSSCAEKTETFGQNMKTKRRLIEKVIKTKKDLITKKAFISY